MNTAAATKQILDLFDVVMDLFGNKANAGIVLFGIAGNANNSVYW